MHKQSRRTGGGVPVRGAGYVMIAFTLALLVMLGAVGLAFDIGRMYITRSEAQSYVDSGAIAAVLQMDGTFAGINRARQAALSTTKGWQFGTSPFTSTEVLFATSAAGPWVANPAAPADTTHARVTTRVNLPLYLLPVLVRSFTSSIAATAVATQVPDNSFKGGGVFPFSPYAHPTSISPNNPDDLFNMLPAEYKASVDATEYSYRHGGLYTLRWPANIKVPQDLSDPTKVCPGDADALMVDIAKATGEQRGYIWHSASDIRETILGEAFPDKYTTLSVGDTVDMTGGAKQTEIDAIIDRVNQDTDTTTEWYVDYKAKIVSDPPQPGHGNWRRVVTVPINAGPCGPLRGSTLTNPCQIEYPAGTTSTYNNYELIGFAKFFLRPASEYLKGGNFTACAEYIGPAGADGPGGGMGGAGAYVVRLVE